jgi:methyl-accepting chemotaxis protein
MGVFSLRRRAAPAESAGDGRSGPQVHAVGPAAGATGIPPEVAGELSREAGLLGREAAEVRGAIEDTARLTDVQAQSLKALAERLAGMDASQSAISRLSREGLDAVSRAGRAFEGVGEEVNHTLATLREVAAAATQITQIALQTRLVAFNASVEAGRAGEAGRGFGVVADAVKDLAAQVEASSKQILGTVGRLDERIHALAGEIQRGADGAAQGEVHRALDDLAGRVERIDQAATESRASCDGANRQVREVDQAMGVTSATMAQALRRSEAFLDVSERLVGMTASWGLETDDTPFVHAVQQAAAEVSRLFEQALDQRRIRRDDLFDEQYLPIEGSDPVQLATRFAPLLDELLPPVQERMLAYSNRVVFCITTDRNGYVACHNQRYNQPQRPGDTLWNIANCRNRRIFSDRTGQAAGRNRAPFLLQTYRRDMGGGNFVMLKEADAPITVHGEHWGGLRLAYRY